jgi:hypothetical protein
LKVERWVKDGDEIKWQGITFRVLETPGYTRGSVSYITELDGKRIAFTGDLIYGDGRIFDLYSFQDAISEAQIRGYHGYGSRLAELVSSLRKVAAEKPDVIVPARGPVISQPQEAIDRLVGRVQALYRNYLSTNALHWRYRKRIEILKELFPWDDPNYGIDEQWAVFYPYGVSLSPGETAELEVRITNHSPVERTFHVTPHANEGLQLLDHQPSITLPPRRSGGLEIQIRAGSEACTTLVTADIRSEGMEFREWVEAFVTIE